MTDNINYKYIVDYINATEAKSTGLLKELEDYADARFIPIIGREVKCFLASVLEYKRPRTILEVGTAIGYSAIFFSQYLEEGGKIITLEKDGEYAAAARENIRRAGKENVVRVVQGPAEDTIKSIDEELDFVFIDANKSRYKYYFDAAAPLLKPGGIIICDNVLFKGMTANDALTPRKHNTVVRALRDFLSDICANPQFTTSLLPLGDGMSLSVKKALPKEKNHE